MKVIKTTAILSSILFLSACQAAQGEADLDSAADYAGTMILSTTTSTYDAGLLQFLLPSFTYDTGWEVLILYAGTGAALQTGRLGEADVVLVHARNLEDEFVADGYGTSRHDVMFNDFIVVGPAGIIEHNDSIAYTMPRIFEENLPFVSRGDNSGTHVRELELWGIAGIENYSDNTAYIEVGQGMGPTLQMTAEMQAFTLTDRATWYANMDSLYPLTIIMEGDAGLLNPYGIIPVLDAPSENGLQAAYEFVNWMTGERGQGLIGQFGVEEFGAPLFFPEA